MQMEEHVKNKVEVSSEQGSRPFSANQAVTPLSGVEITRSCSQREANSKIYVPSKIQLQISCSSPAVVRQG